MRLECLQIIKPMVVVAVLLGVHVTLGGGCGNSEHLVQFQRNELSSEMFQDFMIFVPGVTQGMRMRGHFKISSCSFGVNQEN